MPKTILVVEDDDLTRKLINDLLQASGYDTVQAANGRDAVDLSRCHHPDLVLMDVRLPGISGLEAARQIKADPDTAQIPVVAVTACAMKGDEDAILNGGCDGYLAKPFTVDAFLSTISRHLE